MKTKIDLSLDNRIIKKITEWKRKNNIGSIEMGIEEILNSYFQNQIIKEAIILIGGKKRRTEEELKNIINIMEKNILFLKENNISTIYLVTNYFHNIYKQIGNGTKYDLKIIYKIEKEPQGTAGAIRDVQKEIDNRFILCYGDSYSQVNINEIIKKHINTKAIVTAAITTSDDTSQYGVVKLDGDNVVSFVEKPRQTNTKLISTGFFVIEKEIYKYIPSFIEKNYVMLEDLFEQIKNQNKLIGYIYPR
ncbi:MAG: hypothetical protein B6U87_02130 [Candidatus Aenigmarchaeota archaeon ex4484_52]|nr:MAG: hypothetical protein B6U87_02130 [Candidatus Aenigmarchaeota archaeon ex4484_52]